MMRPVPIIKVIDWAGNERVTDSLHLNDYFSDSPSLLNLIDSQYAFPILLSTAIFCGIIISRMVKKRRTTIFWVENCESKEDALDFFRGMRSSLKLYLTRLGKRIEDMEKIKAEMDGVIKNIESLKDFNIERIKDIIKNI